MSAIGGTWYVSDSMGFAERIDNVPVDYYRYVYATQPDGRKFIVAKTYSGDDSDYEGTARLIAAAPELLAIAKQLEAWEADADGYYGDLADLACTARALIAKAEGRGEQCAPTEA